MTIGQICNRDTVIVRKDDSIAAAAQLMREFHVGSVVVVEEAEGAKPIGILTDRDLVVEVLAAELGPETVSVGDIMSYELATAQEDDDLWSTLQRMRAKGVRRMPVVNRLGALVGIVSSDDLLEFLVGELGQLVKVFSKEQEREQATRGGLGA